MLQKGAIAGKMMGSQWFAYSKYRGDWQNLSVCKNLVDPIQFVRIRPFCVRIHQENLLPPPFLLLTQQQQRTLGRKTSSKEKPSERSGTWGNIATCVTPTPGSGRLCCHVDIIVTMDWWLVTGDMLWPRALASGAWHPVVTRPIVQWAAPMGWPVPVSELASQWPSLSVQGFKLTPGICHLSSPTSRETKPFNATHQELLISMRMAGQGEERGHTRDGNKLG